MNYGARCFYKSLLNKKQYRKSMCVTNTEIHFLGGHEDNDFSPPLLSAGIVHVMVSPPGYPTIKQALSEIEHELVTSVAISPNFAFLRYRNKDNPMTGVFFKGDRVGLLKEVNDFSSTVSIAQVFDFLPHEDKEIWEQIVSL